MTESGQRHQMRQPRSVWAQLIMIEWFLLCRWAKLQIPLSMIHKDSSAAWLVAYDDLCPLRVTVEPKANGLWFPTCLHGTSWELARPKKLPRHQGGNYDSRVAYRDVRPCFVPFAFKIYSSIEESKVKASASDCKGTARVKRATCLFSKLIARGRNEESSSFICFYFKKDKKKLPIRTKKKHVPWFHSFETKKHILLNQKDNPFFPTAPLILFSFLVLRRIARSPVFAAWRSLAPTPSRRCLRRRRWAGELRWRIASCFFLESEKTSLLGWSLAIYVKILKHGIHGGAFWRICSIPLALISGFLAF